jgi:DNA-binding transcriptional MocR family regulator
MTEFVENFESFLDIGNGYPNDEVLPNRMIKNATVKLFEYDYELACEKSSPPLAYGDDTFFYRSRLASMLTAHSGRDFVDPELLVPTAGVSHALDLLSTMFAKGIENLDEYFIFMEETSYFLTMGMFTDHNIKIRPVRVDVDGVVVDDLRSQLADVYAKNVDPNCTKKQFPLFLYIIPEFHNPTGSCLSTSRRVDLVALAAQYDLMIVADEVYQMLDITNYIPRPINTDSDNPLASVIPDVIPVTRAHMKQDELPEVPEPLEPMLPLATTNTLPFLSLSALKSPHVITLSSFSKILSPGLRVGWIEFPEKKWVDMYNDLAVVQSTSCICHFASNIVAVLMDDSLKSPSNQSLVAMDVFNEDESTCPLYSHIHNLRVIYGIKYQILTTALVLHSQRILRDLFPDNATAISPDAPNLPHGFSIMGYRVNTRIGGYFIWIELPAWCCAKETDTSRQTHKYITPAELAEMGSTSFKLGLKLGYGCAVDGSEEGAGHGRVRMCFAK